MEKRPELMCIKGASPEFDRAAATMAREIGEILVRYEAHLQASKGRFNLFTVLRNRGDEVGLHSRWLAYLLDPNESHDCGTLFLDAFLRIIGRRIQPHADSAEPISLPPIQAIKSRLVSVHREWSFGDGRLDLILECPSWGVIVIENKIWAPEQKEQLATYAKYCEQRTKAKGEQFLLLYLTLDGKASEQDWLYKKSYYRISYAQHILEWIEECLRATYAFIPINQALQQYAAVISGLINRSVDHVLMDQITETLRRFPALIANHFEIERAYEELKNNYWNEFRHELQAQLGAQGVGCSLPDKGDYRQFCLEDKIQLKLDHEFALRFRIEWGVKEDQLIIGAAAHHYDESTRVRIWEQRHRYEGASAPWVMTFPESFREVNSWWPLGVLPLCTDFMTPAYLAKNASMESTSVSSQVAGLVSIITRFLSSVGVIGDRPELR